MPMPSNAASDQMEKLQFPGTDVQQVLAYYGELTGKRIVADNTVQGQVNIFVKGSIPRDEAIKIIEINLLLNGFSLVPEPGTNIVKVIGLGKNPKMAGVPIFSSLDEIPEDDRVITFVFKLQFADPTEVAQELQQAYVFPQIFTSLTPLPKAQALIVTENSTVIRGLAKLIREIDVPPAEVISEFIQLQRADAKDVMEKLEKIFEKPQTGAAGGAATRPIRQPVATEAGAVNLSSQAPSVTIDNTGATGLSEDSVIVGRIKLTADIRTNRIHVITRPINLPFVRRLIREFDSDIRFAEPAKRALKYISASDVLDVIVKAITAPGEKPEEASTTGAGKNAGNSQNGGPGNYSQANLGGTSSSSSSGTGDLNVSEGLSTQAVDTTPKAVTIGSTKIIADPRENTIIVLGNREVQQKIFKLLDQLDVRAPQVMLNTVIGELSLTNDQDYGINALNIITNAASTSGSTSVTGTNIFNNAVGFASRGFQLAASSGLSQYGFAARNLEGTVQALESTGRFRVTNRPMIFTSNNKKAIIVSGSEIAVPTQTLSNLVNGTTLANSTAAVSSSVEFKKVALQLEVVPLINSDREVSLDILQKLDSLSGQSTNVGGNSIPTIQTRYLRSNISVPNRATIVLGGLITRTISASGAGVPLLGRVPILGYLFKQNTKQNDRSELVVLIRPVVMTAPGETMDNSKTERERLMIEPNIEGTINDAAPAPTPNRINFRYQDFKQSQ